MELSTGSSCSAFPSKQLRLTPRYEQSESPEAKNVLTSLGRLASFLRCRRRAPSAGLQPGPEGVRPSGFFLA